MYPKIYIDTAVPEGWAKDYPTFDIRDADSSRNFLERYGNIKGSFKIGLDFRNCSYFVMTLFLKFIEETSLEIIIRALEPVPPTMISRMADINKESKVEGVNPLKILLGERITSQKVLELK